MYWVTGCIQKILWLIIICCIKTANVGYSKLSDKRIIHHLWWYPCYIPRYSQYIHIYRRISTSNCWSYPQPLLAFAKNNPSRAQDSAAEWLPEQGGEKKARSWRWEKLGRMSELSRSRHDKFKLQLTFQNGPELSECQRFTIIYLPKFKRYGALKQSRVFWEVRQRQGKHIEIRRNQGFHADNRDTTHQKYSKVGYESDHGMGSIEKDYGKVLLYYRMYNQPHGIWGVFANSYPFAEVWWSTSGLGMLL